MNKKLAINLLRGFVLGTNEQLHEAVFMAIRALKAEPKHGRWVAYEFGNERWHKCSVCGVADEYINSFGLEAIRNYCPYCGARMDEVEE